MREYKQIPVPATTRKVLALVTCDICGDKTKRSWGKEYGDVAEVTVECKTGTSYPECGSGELTSFDVCPKCFFSKLVPWVEGQGGSPTVTDWDF